jgi:hypothetical protein
MIGSCPVCSAPLGPAEDSRGCLTCRKAPLWGSQDRIVAELETANGPLAYWDVKRLLESNGGRPMPKGRLMVSLANDARTCWGGPGIYGLYRHGLLPGVRDTGSAAAVFIHAADTAMSQEQARFLLQHVGYRFLSTSIYLALRRAENTGLLTRQWGLWMPTPGSLGPVLRLWRREDVDAVLERATRQAVRALEAWEDRRS